MHFAKSLEEIQSASTEDAIRFQLVEALKHQSASIFNYGAGRLHTPQGPVIERYWTTMDPAWLQRYVARGYQKLDRLVHAGMARVQPFFFEEIFATPPQLPEQVEMETMFPYRRGVVVPMHSPFGRFGILSAASGLSADEWAGQKARFMANVAILAMTVHQCAERLHQKHLLDGNFLSDREREVLFWSAQGKTSDDMALLLNITERTVRKHIASAMDKLGATSRTQAVVYALSRGLVTVP